MIARLQHHPVLESIAITLGAAIVAAHIGIALVACSGCSPKQLASGADAATYVAGVERCLQRYTPDQCEERVACKQAVQVDHGLAPSGSCGPIEDGGTGGGAQ